MHVVVLGAGIAGMNAAIKLRKRLRPEDRITVVAREEHFVWRPSLPWVAFALRRPEQIMIPVQPALCRRGISYLKVPVLGIEPQRREVVTGNGPVPYDCLIIALGAQLDWSAVPGADVHGHIVCRVDGARRMLEAVYRLEQGSAVFGVASVTGCPAPAYESAFLLDEFLRRSGRRKAVEIHFVTVESTPLESVGSAPSRIVEAEFRKRGIRMHLNTGISAVESGRVALSNGAQLPSTFTLIMPPYRGSQAMMASPDLVEGRGFVMCDLSMQHPRFPEVFAAGDGVNLDVPKTGHNAELQAKVAASNVASILEGKEPTAQFSPELFCNMPLGRSRGLLGIWKPSPPALANFQVQVTYAGRPAMWMKAAFERYYLWKLR